MRPMFLLLFIVVDASTPLPVSLKLKVAATEVKTATSMALYAGARLSRTIEQTRSSYLKKKAKVVSLTKGALTPAVLQQFGVPAQNVIDRLLQADNIQLAKMHALIGIGRKVSGFLKTAMMLKDTAPPLPKETYAVNLSPLEQAQETIAAAQAELSNQRASRQRHSQQLHAAVAGALSSLKTVIEGPGGRRLAGQASIGRPVLLNAPHHLDATPAASPYTPPLSPASTGALSPASSLAGIVSMNAESALPKVLALLRNAKVLVAEIASENLQVEVDDSAEEAKLVALEAKVTAAQQAPEAKALHQALQTQEFQVLRQQYGDELQVLEQAQQLCRDVAGGAEQ
jgi:hypothetical protein